MTYSGGAEGKAAVLRIFQLRRAGIATFGLLAILLTCRVHPAAAQGTPAAPQAEKNPTFSIFEFRVLGNTVLPIRDIETAVYPYLGETKSLADVELARDALVAAYRKAGFGTVSIDIPEQSVEEGVVRLAVLEGRVEHVEVKGARYFSGREIRAALPELKPGAVPNITQLQGELVDLARASPDRSVTPALRAGTAPGQVNVALNVTDHVPFHGSLEVNNRATADTAPTRLSGTLSYDYLFNRPQTISIQYQTSPSQPNEVNAWAFTWFDHSGGANPWTAYFVDSKSDVAALGTVGVLGTGTILGLRRIFALIQDAGGNLTFSIGADYKNFKESVFTDPTTQSDTPIHYMAFSASAAGNAQSGHWSFDGNGSANFGARGLVNDEAEFEYKRYGAHADFFYLRGQSHLSYALPLAMAASLRVTAQWSPDPLIANEQLSLGGVDTVRGYLEAEVLADTAAAASLELMSPRWVSRADSSNAFTISGLAFLDGGIGLMNRPLPGEDSKMHLGAYGLGLTFTGPWELNGLFDVARTLSAGSRTGAHDTRIHFMLRAGF